MDNDKERNEESDMTWTETRLDKLTHKQLRELINRNECTPQT